MAGLDPAIHALLPRTKTWMPATSAGMTTNVRHILENAALAVRAGAGLDFDRHVRQRGQI